MYPGSESIRTLQELVHNYDALVDDSTRVLNRIKAVYRSRGIRTAGRDVYYKRNRDSWIKKLPEGGLRQRTEFLYPEWDMLKQLRQGAKREMLREARWHSAYAILKAIPALGPIRVAPILAAIAWPERFRTKRQRWTYCGLAVVTRSSAGNGGRGRPRRED